MEVAFAALAGALAGAIVSNILCEAHFKAIDKVVEEMVAKMQKACIDCIDDVKKKVNSVLHKR